jgi:hypothetical protein
LAWAISKGSPFTVLYDSCVLYPAPLRDLLMQLALTDLFRAKWTNAIHEEWISNLLANRPDLTRPQLERTRDLMNANARDCLVSGFDALITAIDLPDAHDRHVLAAAIVGRADLILTFNLKHFPVQSVARYGIEAQHPDEFIVHLLGLDERRVCNAVQDCRLRLKAPPKSIEEYLDTLAAQRLPEAVSWLRDRADWL